MERVDLSIKIWTCFEIKLKTGNTLGYIVKQSDWLEKNYGDDQALKVLANNKIQTNEVQNELDVVELR